MRKHLLVAVFIAAACLGACPEGAPGHLTGATQREAASSVAPICPHIGARCVLASHHVSRVMHRGHLLDRPLALGFATAPAVDIYIRGTVTGRVPGTNVANVDIRWDYKCLGDRLGEATYTWTLKLVRRLPRPEATRTLMSGTSKTGSTRVQLAPGRWEPLAEPFRCQTDRGAGSTAPELGAAFVVPDYCAWTATTLRGRAQVEQRGAVRALGRGGAVRPGDTVVVAGGSALSLQSRGGGTSLRLAAGARVRVDARQCGRQGGWKVVVAAGTVTTRLAERDTKRSYQLTSPNAVTKATRASWTVETRTRSGRPWTRVQVTSGRVSVTTAGGGKPVTVVAGRQTVVAGSSRPTAPR